MLHQVLVSDAKLSVAINAFGSFLYASVLNQHVLAAQPLLELGVREPAGPELLRVGLLGGSFGHHRVLPSTFCLGPVKLVQSVKHTYTDNLYTI